MRAITTGLPRQPRRDNHYAAMPHEDVPAFVQTLREKESFSRLSLEFVNFTAARSVEMCGATWDEFDLEKSLWTLPKERMKAFREHVVRLAAARCASFSGARGSVSRCANWCSPVSVETSACAI